MTKNNVLARLVDAKYNECKANAPKTIPLQQRQMEELMIFC